jgi:hypothetical protein
MIDEMEPATTVRFATAARALATVARARHLVVPAFRSPPRLAGVDRTITRRPRGGVVAVRVRDRPWAAVLADMIEGVLTVNGLAGVEADAIRALLGEAAGDALASRSVDTDARVA